MSPTLRLQRMPLIGRYFRGGEYPIFPENVEYGDIIKGLSVSAESCAAVYCSHVLEHLALDDFRTAIQNSYLYLNKGGIFRFVVPDLERLARDYLNSQDANAAILFMEQSNLGRKTRPRGGEELLREWFGNSPHLWMWDFKALSAELERVGFRKIRRAQFGDSEESLFSDVEDPDRWKDCLGVECVK